MKPDYQKKRELLIQLLQQRNAKTQNQHSRATETIAIVGLSGRYPMSDSIADFWENLRNCRSCISDVPEDRWRWRDFIEQNFDQDDYSCRRGGFITDIDKFDPLFFGISPREAERMDPQERLFLQTSWHMLEDAGYTPEGLNRQSGKVGVFVGVMNSNYSILGSALWAHNQRSDRVYACNPTFWSIANRVSYCFDFDGPSLAIDSACSSSLTAIHLACESIKRGECGAAIAGGVNLIMHPAQLDGLAKMNMLSRRGKCHSFGNLSDGFIDGEGVGAVLLKPLKRALSDGDHIYATIKASSINSGGKTAGFTVPNPNAQADLVDAVIRKANINPREISYVEAHGTGTSLGDPIEVRGLTKAFSRFTGDRQFCALGSVKANIGHLEAAAGISGLTKILLQMKHNVLVPSINAETENKHIDFAKTPFYLQKTVTPWAQNGPRIAAISSFGAGGSNAHIILQSYEPADRPRRPHNKAFMVPLSAATDGQLGQYAKSLLDVLKKGGDARPALADIAFTLSTGRIGLPARVAFLAADTNELVHKLARYSSGENEVEGVYQGVVARNHQPESAALEPADLQAAARAWVKGDIDALNRLFEGVDAARLPLPGYPFLKERYWINTDNLYKQPAVQSVPAHNPGGAAEPRAGDKGLLYMAPCWRPMPISNGTPPSTRTATLIFTDRAEEHDAIETALVDAGHDCDIVFVETAKSFSKISANRYSVSPRQKENFTDLLKAVSGDTPVGNIIFAFAGGRPGTGGNEGLQALLYLCQSLVENKLDQKARLLVWSVDNGGKDDLVTAACAGFVKSLKAERPSWHIKQVIFADDGGGSLAFQMNALNAELREPRVSHAVVRYAAGQRTVEQLQALQVADDNPNPAPAVRNGTYLITGGTGGLGRIFASHFAAAGNINLILTGRSQLDDDKRSFIDALKANDNEVVYYTCDVTSRQSVEILFEKIRSRFQSLNGIIHSAGVLKDCLLPLKEWPAFGSVIAPKVQGIDNLDAASADMSLDFFAAFSSVSSILGNMGQCDYAFGNSYMDGFCHWRNRLVGRGERSGHSISINWPIWNEGGMHIDPRLLKNIEQRIGVVPLDNQDGIEAFNRIIASGSAQAIPIYGIRSRIIEYLKSASLVDKSIDAAIPAVKSNPASAVMGAKVSGQPDIGLDNKLREITAQVLDMAPGRIDADVMLGDFGFDSITLQEFAGRLQREFGVDVSPAVFFSHNTLNKIKAYLLANYPRQVAAPGVDNGAARAGAQDSPSSSARDDALPAPREIGRHAPPRDSRKETIAIIGMSGIFPGAEDLETFWKNLINGIDPISEIPPQRWRWQDYYGSTFGQTNKMNSRWGGFIPDVDKFDYRFFGVSESEALFMDPQQRLFLQTVWKTIENAGYRVADLKAETVGVFVGVEFSDYKDLIDQFGDYKAEMAIGNAHSMVPNRVSFYFDFHGPSEAIDTACSGSLTAVNRAVRSIQSGESSMAIAGGVSLTLSPKTMIGTSQLNIYSPDGRCKTLDKKANGYVKGEGVGAILLKPLSRALEDGDNIIGLIKGCSINHGGRSNSITAPNPEAQARLLVEAYKEARIDPECISYLEMHGTGTNLGDPVEVEGMKSAFRQLADHSGKPSLKKRYCGIGSVKTNIGHLEPAAGIAGLIKVLLAMREQQLPPNLHFEELNPLIKLDDTPFYVVDKPRRWERQTDADGTLLPYVAGISSFGFGGSNAHVVIEEWMDDGPSRAAVNPANSEYLLVLSAKNEDRLHEYAQQLLGVAATAEERNIPLADACYTLQIGREPMDERLAFVVRDWEECNQGLRRYIDGEPLENGYSGNIHDGKALIRELRDTDFENHILNKREARLLAKWWVLGMELDWRRLYRDTRHRRHSLPTYPFAKTPCWIPLGDRAITVSQPAGGGISSPQQDIAKAPIGGKTDSRPARNDNGVYRLVVEKIAKAVGITAGDIKMNDHLSADLNLDSIKMMGLINELISSRPKEQIQYFNNLGMNAIINRAQTVAGLVEIFEEAGPKLSGGPQIAPASPESERAAARPSPEAVTGQPVELLHAQQLFLPAYFLTRSSSLCSYIEIEGTLDIDLAHRCWKKLIDRHPALRTRFNWPGKANAPFSDVTAELLRDCTPPEIALTDLSTLRPAEKDAAVNRFFEALLNRQWDLAQWPLHEISVIKKSDNAFILFWSNEHIVSDGLGNQQALREFLELYQASIDDTEPPAGKVNTEEQYRNLVRSINAYNDDLENKAYSQFSRTQTGRYCFNPENRQRSIATARFVNLSRRLTVEETRALIELTKTSRFTLNTLLIGAFLQVLSTYDKSEPRFILQIPTSGRVYPDINVSDSIGCFAQNLSLPFDRVRADDTLEHTLETVQTTIVDCLMKGIDRSQTRQLAMMVTQMTLTGDNTLPQHSVDMLLENVKSNLYLPYTGHTRINDRYGDLHVTGYAAGTSNSPGAIDLLQEIFQDSLHVFCNYDANCFSSGLIANLIDDYIAALKTIGQLRVSLINKSSQAVAAGADGRTAYFAKLVKEVCNIEIAPADMQKDLEAELGLDSLDRIRLVTRLQSSDGASIDRAKLIKCRTLNEMAIAIGTNATETAVAAEQIGSRRAIEADESRTIPETLTREDLPIALIIEQCGKTPDATAVTHYDGTAITYRELNERSNQIAHRLTAGGIGRGDYVGLLSNRGPLMLIGILAVLKAGAAYVPIDPVFPAGRIRYILNHARINTLLTTPDLMPVIEDLFTDRAPEDNHLKTLVFLKGTAETTHKKLERKYGWHIIPENDWRREHTGEPEMDIHPDDDMVVLFTSGSTGNPKGVLLNHVGYANRLQWHQKIFQLQPGEKVAQKTSCCFDVSLWELFWPLMYGGIVCAVEKQTVSNPWEFADWIEREGISIVHFVPSMFGEFVNTIAADNRSFSSLRWLIFSGEALPTNVMQKWIDQYGLDIGLCNLYGPTEASIDVSYHFIERRPDDGVPIPIGKPVDNTTLLILDKEGKPAPKGEMGELCIGGIQLAKGYLYQPELTSKAFIDNTVAEGAGNKLYRTGDLAVERDDGSFEYHGRLDSQVKLRGFRIELGEIENVAAGHQAINEAAALVVNRGGADRLALWYAGDKTDPADIKAFIGKQCPDYMVPHLIFHLDLLPKNSNGKLDRKALLNLLKEHTEPKGAEQVVTSYAAETVLPTGPAQKWIFAYFDAPYSWWGYSRVQYKNAFNENTFTAAINRLIERHDALRTRFANIDGKWMQIIAGKTPPLTPEFHDYSDKTWEEREQAIQRLIPELAGGLDYARWPLCRFAVIRSADDLHEIIWVAHHLISDLMSGQALLREIRQLYMEIENGDAPGSSGMMPASYAGYVESLQKNSGDDTLSKLATYWMRHVKKKRGKIEIPFDHQQGENVESSGRSVIMPLDPAGINLLQRQGRKYYEASLYHLLAAPAYKIIADTLRCTWIVLSHKLNGRNPGIDGQNYFDCFGNFAVNAPVGVAVRKGDSFKDLVAAIRDELADMPMGGASYDWISHELPADAYPDDKLTSIRINYLGDTTPPAGETFEGSAGQVNQRLSPPGQKRTTLLEFFFYTHDKQTYLEISYSDNFYKEETIKQLAAGYINRLQALISELEPETTQTN